MGGAALRRWDGRRRRDARPRAGAARRRGGWTSEVAATCASDHMTWRDELPAGASRRGRRARAPLPRRAARRARATTQLHGPRARWPGRLRRRARVARATACGRRSCTDFSARSRRTTTCASSLRTCSARPLWGAQIAPDRSALLPCLHDEPYAYLADRARRRAQRARLPLQRRRRGRLAGRLYGPCGGGVVGHGLRPAAGRRPPTRRPARPRAGQLPRLRRPPRGGQARARSRSTTSCA